MNTVEFLSALYGTLDVPAFVALSTTKSNGRGRSITIAEVPSEIDLIRPEHTQWYSVCARSTRPTTGHRGAENEVGVVPALWVDIDTSDGIHSTNGLLDRAKALDGLRDLPLPPSVVVDSGGGLHVYWLLREPWKLDDARERAHARELVRAWQRFIATRLDAHVDDTSDLARDLRLPGTMNRKYDPPRLVQIVDTLDRRYDPTDIEEALATPGIAVQSSRGASPPTGFKLAGGRNDRLKQVVAACLDRRELLDVTLREVIDLDSKHEPPLFADPTETARVTPDPWTNALIFVTRICASINRSRVSKGLPPQRLRGMDEPVAAPSNEETISALDFARWTATRYTGPAPERRWLVERVFPRAVPTMVAAMGDAGKSMLLLDLALKVARPAEPGLLQPEAFGAPIAHHGAVVVLTAEDDAAEIHSRLAALDPGEDRLGFAHRLIVVALPSAGGPIALVEKGKTGPQASAAYALLVEALSKVPDLALVVIDPLSSFVHVDVNADPVAGAYACSLFARMATRLDATVLLAHHMRKSLVPIATPEGARDAIRGSSALVDGLRAVYALWPADEKEATAVCQRANRVFAPNVVYRGAVVKSNGPSDRMVRWYLRSPDSGLLIEYSFEVRQERGDETGDLSVLLEQSIRHAAELEVPFTRYHDHGLYARREELSGRLRGLSRNRLQELVDHLIDERRIQVVQDGRKALLLPVSDPVVPF